MITVYKTNKQNLRHVREKSEGAQELVQRIEGGLAHIGELLGIIIIIIIIIIVIVAYFCCFY